MSGFELNKFIASLLLASLIASFAGFIADILYKPDLKPKVRGYSVQTNENPEQNQAQAEEEPIDLKALMAKANAESGKDTFKKCLSCHSEAKGAPNRVGPNLWKIVGRDKASLGDYKYSDALTKIGGKWDEESLFDFIRAPKKFAPGTKMTFVGLSKPEEVADVIAFLKKYATE